MSREEIDNIFDAGGILENKIPGYEYRQGQHEMALDVYEAFENKSRLVVEAGTGIGKSFAYLAPAILHIKKSTDKKEKIVVSTSTKNLQSQLLDKDFKVLKDALDCDVSVALAVGKENYLCLERLRKYSEDNALLAQEKKSFVSCLSSFASRTSTGLLSEMNYTGSDADFDKVCCHQDVCKQGDCPFISDCFYFKAANRIRCSSVIVTNHHLLLNDAMIRFNDNLEYSEDALLPAFSSLVIDECHNLSSIADDISVRSLDYVSLKRLLSRFEISGKILLDFKSLSSKFLSDFKSLNNLLYLMDSKSHIVIDSSFNAHLPYVKKILTSFRSLLEFISSYLNNNDMKEEQKNEFRHYCTFLLSSYDTLLEFAENKSMNPDFVYYLESFESGREKFVRLGVSTLDISSWLCERLFSKIPCIVCTSATVRVGSGEDSFSYFKGQTGLDSFKSIVCSSPFDYLHNSLLLTLNSNFTYNGLNGREYDDFIKGPVYSAVSTSQGGALVLFSSFSSLNNCYDSLKEKLEDCGLKVLKQGFGDKSRLLRDFKKNKNSVLFATESFWEGVDIPGDALRLVIITKLPFRYFDTPLNEARRNWLISENKNPFFERSLPEAVIKFKQGFGRLIRNKTDRGIVLVLDNRILSKFYGQVFISSLPNPYCKSCTLESLEDEIAAFFF